MTEQKRRITRELGKHETWLINWQRRVDREQSRHIDAQAALEQERDEYLKALDETTLTALESMGVIGGGA